MITIDRKSRSRLTGNDDHLGLEIAITFSRNAHASGMLVQLLRAATECEFDLVPEPGQVMQRARTSDAKSSNSPPAQGALHDPITLD